MSVSFNFSTVPTRSAAQQSDSVSASREQSPGARRNGARRNEAHCNRARRVPCLVVLIIAVASTCGCSPNRPDKLLVGTWEIDQSEQLATRMLGQDQAMETGEQATDDALAAASQRLQLQITFARNGVLRTSTQVMGEVRQKSGTWTAQEVGEERVQVEFELNEGEIETIEVRILGPNQIEMVPPNLAVLGRKYIFRRAE